MNISLRQLFFSLILVFVTAVPMLAVAQDALVPCGFDVNNDNRVGPEEECGFNDLIETIERVMNFLIYQIATPIAAIMFAIAGYMYLTAGDNESKVHHAHDIFISVLWGFGIMIIAWALVSFILNLFAPGQDYNLLDTP